MSDKKIYPPLQAIMSDPYARYAAGLPSNLEIKWVDDQYQAIKAKNLEFEQDEKNFNRAYQQFEEHQKKIKENVKDKAKEPFDPEGEGYDYESAISGGLKEGEDGHWASRNPKTGQILKGRKHPTYNLAEEGEAKAGYIIEKGEDGKYYSQEEEELPENFGMNSVEIMKGGEITTEASTYGWGEKGLKERTADGRKFDPNKKTAAMWNMPFGTKVKVTDEKTGKSIIVTVNDRGPKKEIEPDRSIDLSKGAWKALGYDKPGLTNVKVEMIK